MLLKYLCLQCFFLSTFGRPSRSTREIIKEFWKRPYWNASGPSGRLLMAPILGSVISSWRFFFQEQLWFCCKETNRPNCSTRFLEFKNWTFSPSHWLLDFPWSQEHHQGFRQLPRPGGANHWFATSWVKVKGEWFSVQFCLQKKTQQAHPSPSTAS